jgi:DNA-binding MarR family transcriptional regulator/ribosomal protein L40E
MEIQEILSMKHAFSLFLYLYEKGEVKQNQLLEIIPSTMTIDKLTKIMEKEGYIHSRKEVLGRKIYFFSLTEKGRKVAEQLKRTESVGGDISAPDPSLALSSEEAEMTKRLTLLFHINVLDDHITVQENPPGEGSRVFNIYVKRNGNGEFRLWCEYDDSYDCWHVKAAWTYPHVQKMMMHYKGKIRVCPLCGYENPEEADYCMKCGAKLVQ